MLRFANTSLKGVTSRAGYRLVFFDTIFVSIQNDQYLIYHFAIFSNIKFTSHSLIWQ